MILDQIVADTRELVAKRKGEQPVEALRELAGSRPRPLDLADALRGPGVSIIAEIKRASPSRGALNLSLSPGEQAVTYADAGAAAISVLTEPTHFLGAPEHLIAARAALSEQGAVCPILRKDFIIDAYQLWEALAWGADAILLIVAALSDEALSSLHERAQELGLSTLVEVHNRQELARALPLRTSIIGINNRNLHDFSVALETTRTLRPLIPPDCLVVSESGIHDVGQMRSLAEWGLDAALVGEALVSTPDPAAKLVTLREAGQ